MIRVKNTFLKWVLYIALSVGLGYITLLASCYGFGKFLYHQNGCEAFQIDNTEMHTAIDIPDLLSGEGISESLAYVCDYNPKTRIKRNFFIIDKASVKMPRYISFCEFKVLAPKSKFNTNDFVRFNSDTLNKLMGSQSLFFKERTKENGEYYKALLDSSSGQVWILLKYAE